jgi:carboxyl-terminal processing protease
MIGAARAKVKQRADDKLPPMRRSWNIAAVALFAVAVVAGGLLGSRLLALTDETRDLLRAYTELIRVAHDTYGADIEYGDLVESSIRGVLRRLDPHTSYLSPESFAEMRERQQESFHGLGILVGLRNGLLTVMTPIEGTPASRLGIRAGDVIETIEGEPTEGMDLNEAVRRLKGPKGTKVRITIARLGLDEPLELTVTRDEIPQNTVRYAYMIAPETGYISLSDFNRGTGREVAEALESLRAQGMERLVLDLRGNGGGLLDQAIAVAEQFLPDNAKIVETRGRTRDSFQEYRASSEVDELNLPLVILVGAGTASAAEILAGAVQDHDMGLIVGTPTWGKGLVQTVYSLSYDAGLAITTAKYYTPSGRLIQRDYSSWFDYSTMANGGLEHLPQGDQEAYTTDLGRTVYAGGGITPDVIVEPSELSPELQLLLSRSAFFDFAVAWALGHEIPNRDWVPPDGILEEFIDWSAEHELLERDELVEIFASDETRATALRQIRAEVFNSVFGLQARYEALAAGDEQVQRALELLDQASELLARRLDLERQELPKVETAAAIG